MSESSETCTKEIKYSKSEEYWATQPATVNGMLGGYEHISDVDIEQSQKFLDNFLNSKGYRTNSYGVVLNNNTFVFKDVFKKNLYKIRFDLSPITHYLIRKPNNKNKIDKHLAVDCGAGIGRITKHLLLKNFENAEMVEVTESFLSESKKYLGEPDSSRVLKFHCCGLQDFHPESNRYDCIWIQWVLGYLKDNDLVEFFKRCKTALKPNGIIILKENVSVSEPEWDDVDSSWTRPRQAYLNLIHRANMVVIREEKQRKFPDEIYEVRFFAFK